MRRCAPLLLACSLAGCFTTNPLPSLAPMPAPKLRPETPRPAVTAEQITPQNARTLCLSFSDEMDRDMNRQLLGSPSTASPSNK